jgi:hypothetical protein
MKTALKIALMVMIVPVSALAATPLNYDLAKKAIELSGTVDAYGTYCEKPTTFADDFMKRFKDTKLNQVKVKELESIQKKNYDTSLSGLKKEKKDCKDINLLLKRLEIMRALKDVSYELNGIDPSTVKDNIPSLEVLAPDAPIASPQDVSPEEQ